MRFIIALLRAILRYERKTVELLEQILVQLTNRPVRLFIQGANMDVLQGTSVPFTITCFNGATPPAPTADTNGSIVFTVTPADASATAGAPSSPGVYPSVFNAGLTLGATSVVGSDSVLTSNTFTDFNVVANPAFAPASLVITSP